MSPAANYFALFGLPLAYEVDLARLEEEYERLTLEHHPDFFAAAGVERRNEAERISAEMNEGYRVLRADASRASHMLGLLAGVQALDTTHLPEGILEEMFELQEQLDEWEAASDEQALRTAKSLLLERSAALREGLGELFDRAAKSGSTEALQEIQTRLNCDNYLRRLLERLP